MTARAGKAGNGGDGAFAFSKANLKRAEAFVAKYPEGRQASAILPLLDLAQRQNGWLSGEVIRYVADYLGMPHIRALEVATFYSMFRLAPGGKHTVNVCTTTPCWLRGSSEVLDACREVLGIEPGETTGDGACTLGEVECLGACVNAPVLQIDDAYFEDLDADSTRAILEALKRGEVPTPGPQVDRQTSCPAGGPTTLNQLIGDA